MRVRKIWGRFRWLTRQLTRDQADRMEATFTRCPNFSRHYTWSYVSGRRCS